MNKLNIKIIISVLSILIALTHILFPNIKIDAITVTLIGLAVLPWLGELLKSFELPGGLKIEYQDLKKIEDEARESGLLNKQLKVSENDPPTYIKIASEDPNLALAGLRIELEKELIALATKHKININNYSLYRIARELAGKKIISGSTYIVINDLSRVLNRAVHGAEVDIEATDWALTIGQQILDSISEK